MKIALCSDVHLEFAALPIENTEGADVLLLAGDICTAAGFSKPAANKIYHQFFKQASEQFKDIIYIMGNHEHYHGDFAKTYDVLKNELQPYSNIRLMEKEVCEIGGIVFIGLTLWTDFNNSNPVSMNMAEGAMNDYRVIKNTLQNRRFSALDTLNEHKISLDKIDEVCKSGSSVVVVGHHAPSKKSIKPQYERDYHVNGAYSSSLEEFILDRPNIKLWVHGHTHHEFDYIIGQTRVVCNPRGYVGYERNSQDVEPYIPLIIDVK